MAAGLLQKARRAPALACSMRAWHVLCNLAPPPATCLRESASYKAGIL